MSGYAVVDLETTGIAPQQNRVIEVGVVLLDVDGSVEHEWATLLNPKRDLGPQGIHGVVAADVLDAPTFADVAGDLIALLRGRVLASHNLNFEVMHLRAEFERLGLSVPIYSVSGVCTMSWATRLLPGAGRSLADCCLWAGVPFDADHAHEALVDAYAAAQLLQLYLSLTKPDVPWHSSTRFALDAHWPVIAAQSVRPTRRGASAHAAPAHFLARLVERLPAGDQHHLQPYLALLDAALLDRELSVSETRALIDCATGLGLDRHAAEAAHQDYLDALSGAAWADGVITDAERADLVTVANLLGLASEEVTASLERGRPRTDLPTAQPHSTGPGTFTLDAGDGIVFTGDMDLPRSEWERRATAAGYLAQKGVTKKTKLLVAADPDSQSGKAAQARRYGIPIVGEHFFASLL